jgi:NAD+ kinase
MKKIGIHANRAKPRAEVVLERLGQHAAAIGMSVYCPSDIAQQVPGATAMEREAMLDEVDVLMALGGDGSMLKAVRSLNGRVLPVIGVNLGSLGFLTSVAEEDLERAMDCLAGDDFTTSRRAMLDCCLLHAGGETVSGQCLNDVVLQSASSRVITLAVTVSDEEVTSYICDGLVIATTTGSTGHSLSAGGPIMHPATEAFIVSLLCPHTLSSRPLVVSDQSHIEVCVAEVAGNARLTLDGQIEHNVVVDDRIQVKLSDREATFIHLPDYSYFRVLRQKLGWRGSSV